MPEDPVCHSEACAGHNCPRSTHRFGGFLSSGAERRYLGCTTHRRCEAFEQVEPLAPLSLQPLSEVERAAIGQRLDRADEVLAAAPTWPEEAAYWTDDADGDPGGPLRAPETAPIEEQPVLTEEVIPDGPPLTVEAPVEAAPPEPTVVLAPQGNGLYALREEFDPYDHPVGPVGPPLKRATRRAKRGRLGPDEPPVTPDGPLKRLEPAGQALGQHIANASVDEHFPTPIESYDAWRCTSCFSRSLRPGRCCRKPMQAIRMVMYAREIPDA